MTVNADFGDVVLHHGDCLDVLAAMPAGSVDAVVTDPPYGLEFMGKDWDRPWAVTPEYSVGYQGREGMTLPSHRDGRNANCRTCKGRQRGANRCGCATPAWDRNPRADMSDFQSWVARWADGVLRVLKPGGHLLAFGGTRTYHRLTCGLEDAGFEIRDCIGYGSHVVAWCYGSGFPKSRNVSADPTFCQRVSGLCDHAADAAAESAARLLLAEMRGDSEAQPADLTRLHGVPGGLHPDHTLPSGTQGDVFASLRGPSGVDREQGPTLSERSACDGGVRDVQRPGPKVAEQGGPERHDVLLAALRGEGEDGGAAGARLRRNGDKEGAEVRPGQPGMEGRRDIQAGEGQLRRPEVRPVPAGVASDGEVGRVHRGAPAGNGAVGRPSFDADGVREPHQPRPAGQPPSESRPLADERGSQARRGWPVCGGCGKPRIPLGLGTALKPSWEPIVVARKPLVGTVAANVLAHGTGALNIDGCRIAGDEDGSRNRPAARLGSADTYAQDEWTRNAVVQRQDTTGKGRWPTNVVLDEAAAALLDEQTYGDSGGASRFFYTAKASTAERGAGNTHPTVKPVDLMRWLVRLVTPPGGLVLDPFAGSGTTGVACVAEGFRFVGVEREAEYVEIAARRLRQAPPTLFGGAA